MSDFNEQLARMKGLMNYGKINEESNAPKNYTLEYHATAADGKTYGIIKECNKYYIKRAETGKELVAESYSYLGGFNNKKDYEYFSYANALKHFELKMASINEACDGNVNVSTLNPFRSNAVILEGTESMKDEIARQRQIMYNAAMLMNESTEIGSTPIKDQPEAEKENSGDKDAPFVKEVKPDMEFDGEKEADPENVGEPFGKDGEACGEKGKEVQVDNAVAGMHPSGGKVARVNESIDELGDDEENDSFDMDDYGDDDEFEFEDDDELTGEDGEELDGDEESLEGDEEDVEDDVEDIAGDEDELEGDEDDLEGADEAVDESDPEAVRAEIERLQDVLSNLEGDEEDLEGDEEGLEGDEESLEGDEEDIEGDEEDLEGGEEDLDGVDGIIDETDDELDINLDDTTGEEGLEGGEDGLDDMPELDESKEKYMNRIVESVVSQIIKEDELHVFGDHPGYRKKPMQLPPTGEDKNQWGEDINDDSVHNEEPFGSDKGDSAPFDKQVEKLTDKILEQIKEGKIDFIKKK